MKTYLSLPQDQQFYTRYANLVPTLDHLGVLAQIVSACTEFGIIYSLILSSLAPMWPEYAPPIALFGAMVGTLLLELGLRKFAPYSVRSILYRRWSGLDRWISTFVLLATVGLLASSGLLSFKGSRELVAAVAPEPEQMTTTAADSTQRAALVNLQNQWRADSAQIVSGYSIQAGAIKTATASEIKRHEATIRTLKTREANSTKRYPTAKQKAREAIEAATASRDTQLAAIAADQQNELATAKARLRADQEAARTTYDSELLKIDQGNENARKEISNKVNGYGYGLAWFTVVCLLVFLLSVAIKEIHRAGAKITEQVEPGAYEFEPGAWERLAGATKERLLRKAHGLADRIEAGIIPATAPAIPPTIWERPTGEIRRQSVKWEDSQPMPPQQQNRPFSIPTPYRAAGSATKTERIPTVNNKASDPYKGPDPFDALRDFQRAELLQQAGKVDEAAKARLSAQDVLKAYLGPDATPDNLDRLTAACVAYLEGTGLNPFAHHHRSPIGYAYGERITVNVGSEKKKHCANCEKEFVAKHWNAKYCSDQCRITAWEKRTGKQLRKQSKK